MKKASKFLSMFLLVAMCFSLLGGAAYATSDPFLGSYNGGNSGTAANNNSGSITIQAESGWANEQKVATYSSASEVQWLNKSTNAVYTDLATAVAKASSGATLVLQNGDYTVSSASAINKAVTLDLGKNTLTTFEMLIVNANVTIQNGTLASTDKVNVMEGYTLSLKDITINEEPAFAGDGTTYIYSGTVDSEPASKYIPSGYAWDSDTKEVGAKNANLPIYVSSNVTAHTGYYKSVSDAFAAGIDQDGSVTIQINPNITIADAKTTTDVTEVASSSLTLTLNNNHFIFSGDFETPKTMSVTGTEGSKLIANGGSGTITVPYGATLTLGSNVEVDAIINVQNGGTLIVNGATVKEVDTNGKVTVSGGSTIKSLTANSDSTLNVSGGDITVAANGLANANTASRTVTGGIWHNVTTLSQLTALLSNVNNYASYTDDDEYTNCYKVGSGSGTSSSTNGTVVNPWSSNSSTTTTTAPSSGSYTVDNFTYEISTSGDVAVWPRNGATWSSGNGNLYFYYTPNTAAAQGLTYHFYLDSSAWLISGEDYTDNLTGTMSLGKSLLGTLSEGVHTLILVCDGQTATCTFYISGSLKAVDTDKHVIDSTKSLQFYSTQPISRVWVGDVEITDNYGTYYTLSSDRKTLTLTSDFLNARTAGNTYTLTVQTDAGSTLSSTFQVLTTAQASSSPKTGDASNLALWAAVLVLSGGAAFAIVLPRVKKNED
jgi:hypothetical protein